MLLTGGKVDLKQSQDGITITVPKQYRPDIDTVVVLELDGPASEIAPVDVVSAWPAQQKEALASKTAKLPEAENKQQSEDSKDYLQAKPEDIQWFREARLGMFICWGPVALTGEEVGWSRGAYRPGLPDNHPVLILDISRILTGQ